MTCICFYAFVECMCEAFVLESAYAWCILTSFKVHDFGFFRYDPGAIQFLSYEEIPLAPEAACVGLEIRVVGNDSGEKVLYPLVASCLFILAIFYFYYCGIVSWFSIYVIYLVVSSLSIIINIFHCMCFNLFPFFLCALGNICS